MRKVLISLAAAASALAVAAPASAQWAPQPQGYGYGYNQGYGNYGDIRRLQYRIDRVQQRIEQLRDRRMLSRNEARNLRDESRGIEWRLRSQARYGLDPREARDVEYRIARLEQHVRREAFDRDGRRWGNTGYGYNGYAYADRDHDGRDDGIEHQRWHEQHDGDGDHDD